MLFRPANAQRPAAENAARLSNEANSGCPLKGVDFQRMAKRRFQSPTPFREGNWWWINVWHDVITKGGLTRKRKRMKVAPADLSTREAQRIAAEMLRPMNQGSELIGSATQFRIYVEGVYRRTAFPLLHLQPGACTHGYWRSIYCQRSVIRCCAT